MAKLLMMTGPFAGHVTPSMSIAQKLVERGHEVVWITGRKYKTQVESVGARFRPLPEQSDPGEMEVYDFYPELKELKGLPQIKYWLKHVFLDACQREIAVIDSVLADFPADVLIGDSITFSLYFSAELRRLPSACISVFPGSMPSRDTAPYGLGLLPGNQFTTRMRNHILNLLVFQVMLRDLTAYANRVRQEIGLRALRGPFFSSLPQTMSLILHTSTYAFEYTRSDLPDNIKLIGPIAPPSHPNFEAPHWWSKLKGPDPVVLVNQGTIATTLDDLIVPTVEALRDEEMQIVAVPVQDGELGALPENVHTDVFIPFEHLLPHVDVMVTNGGYGGTQFALAHGIPIVVAGETEDKREVAARAEWSGVGINLRRQRPSPETIRNAVKRVLRVPTYRENARHVQADFAKHDAPRHAADLLERLVSGEAID